MRLVAILACAACGGTSTSTPLGNVHARSGCIPATRETRIVPVQATADAVTVCFDEAKRRCFRRMLTEDRVVPATAPPRDEPIGHKCGGGRCFDSDDVRTVHDVDGARKLVLYSDGTSFEVRDFD